MIDTTNYQDSEFLELSRMRWVMNNIWQKSTTGGCNHGFSENRTRSLN